MDTIRQFDHSLFLLLNGWGVAEMDSFFLFITDKWSSIPLYLIMLFLLFRGLGWKATLWALLFIVLLITCSDQLANLFKTSIARPRPCYNPDLIEIMRLVKSSCGGKYGFYSAHASNSFAVATFISLLTSKSARWGPFLFLFWALTVSYSRIYLGVHFPLDVVAGICAGMILAYCFAILFARFQNKWVA